MFGPGCCCGGSTPTTPSTTCGYPTSPTIIVLTYSGDNTSGGWNTSPSGAVMHSDTLTWGAVPSGGTWNARSYAGTGFGWIGATHFSDGPAGSANYRYLLTCLTSASGNFLLYQMFDSGSLLTDFNSLGWAASLGGVSGNWNSPWIQRLAHNGGSLSTTHPTWSAVLTPG